MYGIGGGEEERRRIRAWGLELGAWSLELGAWSLELGAFVRHRGV